MFYDKNISCAFQHLLYWLTQVPSLAPASCRQEDDRNTIIEIPIECASPYKSCEEVFENETADSGYYPIINSDGDTVLVFCSNK